MCTLFDFIIRILVKMKKYRDFCYLPTGNVTTQGCSKYSGSVTAVTLQICI